MGLFLPGHDLTAADLNDINLFPVAKAADYTASPGEMVLISGGKIITAPANVSGHIWGGKATDANTSNGFSSSTGSFKGPGVDGTTCAIGTTGAFCVWLGDGTDWHLIAGKADSGAEQIGLFGVGSALVGTALVAPGLFHVQAGSPTVTASAGVADITFPVEFATGVLHIQTIVISDSGDVTCAVRSANLSKSGFEVFVTSAGSGYSGSLALSWMAIGW